MLWLMSHLKPTRRGDTQQNGLILQSTIVLFIQKAETFGQKSSGFTNVVTMQLV